MADAGTFTFRFKADTTDFAAKVGGMVATMREKLNTGVQGLVKNQLLQYFTLSGVISQFKELVSYADRYYDMSKKLGVDTTFLQELGYVMEQTGSDLGGATFALKEFKLSLARMNKADLKAFEALGLSADKLRAMKLGDSFREVVIAAGKLSESGRADALSNLFGRGFLSIAPVVGEEWKTITGEFQQLNLAIDEVDIKKLSDVADQMARLRTMKFKAGGAMAGPVLAVTEGFRAEFALFESVLRSTAMFFMSKGGLSLRDRGGVASEAMRTLLEEWKKVGIDEANKEAGASLLSPERLKKLMRQPAKESGKDEISPAARADWNIEASLDNYSKMGLFLTPSIAMAQHTTMDILRQQLQELKRVRKELENSKKVLETSIGGE